MYSFGYFPGVRLWFFILYIQPLKMELIEGSETSANHNRTPVKHPKEYIQDAYALFMKDVNLRDGLLKDEVSYVHISCEN